MKIKFIRPYKNRYVIPRHTLNIVIVNIICKPWCLHSSYIQKMSHFGFYILRIWLLYDSIAALSFKYNNTNYFKGSCQILVSKINISSYFYQCKNNQYEKINFLGNVPTEIWNFPLNISKILFWGMSRKWHLKYWQTDDIRDCRQLVYII